LADETLEGVFGLCLDHFGVDDVLGGLVDANQQRPFLPGDEDGLAVDA
jgi:hypothetical protein